MENAHTVIDLYSWNQALYLNIRKREHMRLSFASQKQERSFLFGIDDRCTTTFPLSFPLSTLLRATIILVSMSAYSDNYLLLSGSGSGTQSPRIPSINIKNEPGSPVNNELLSRSLDIKKQLSQSFQGTSSGGISKPQSRRNSAFHVMSDQDDEDDGQGHERKRRDHINDRIQELLTLIPPDYFQDSSKDQGTAEELAARNTGTKDGKPNKGQILSKSVEYIKDLQNLIDENNRMEVQLLVKLRKLEMYEQGKVNVPVSVGTTSAELALGEIGVGPHSEEYFRKVLKDATGLDRDV